MQIPNADRAVIDPRKLRGYLLSRSHQVGRFKAAFFLALGYSPEDLLSPDLAEAMYVQKPQGPC